MEEKVEQVPVVAPSPKIPFWFWILFLFFGILTGLTGYMIGKKSQVVITTPKVSVPNTNAENNKIYENKKTRLVSKSYWNFTIPSDWHYLECQNDEAKGTIFIGPSILQDSTTTCAFDMSPGIIQITRFNNLIVVPQSDSKNPIVTNLVTRHVIYDDSSVQTEEIIEGQGIGVRRVAYVGYDGHIDVITLHDLAYIKIFDQLLDSISERNKSR